MTAPASLEPNDLLLFARVVETGSFTRAAERVGAPKSTVSRRIAELERRLGERLLLRSTRRLTVTEFGQTVLEHANRLALEVEGTLALAQHRQAMPSGRLRVSMPADFALTVLPDMLAQFSRTYPAVVLELDLSPRRVDLIAENFDLAIRMGSLGSDSQLTARLLGRLTAGLYASPAYLAGAGHPQVPDDLANHAGLMLLNRSGDAMPWPLSAGDGRPRIACEPRVRVLANAPDLLLRLAIDGSGIAGVPDHYTTQALASGALVRVLPGWALPDSEAWAVFPGRRLMPARTRVFLDALVATMAQCDRQVLAGGASAVALPAGPVAGLAGAGEAPGPQAVDER